jgi:hypothetical protein
MQAETPVISAGNVARLRSVQQIDFANLPAEVGEFRSGWFAVSPDGNWLLARTHTRTMLMLGANGALIDTYFTPSSDGLPALMLDGAIQAFELPVAISLHTDGGHYFVAQHTASRAAPRLARLEVGDIPLSIWFSSAHATPRILSEFLPEQPGVPEYVVRFRADAFEIGVLDSLPRTLPNAAENDPDSIIRIGRILPPQAVTVTEAGLVKLWDLETGELVRSANVDGLPQNGAVNAAGTHFVWREGDSAVINLLNLETGENRTFDPDAPYIDWLFVGASGDVVLGVGVDGQPRVVAWDAATGEMIDLGEHRACSRPPDTVRLSRDGTTLVIGCDTGLDLWRIEGTTR